jgi:hypothetical protein
MVCQQWLSVVGLVADIVGFLLIAWEWYRGFTHSVHIRNLQLHDAYERNLAREQGREPGFAMQEEEETMAREFSKLHNTEVGFRRSLFVIGFGLVILGFVLQVGGSWPQADPIFGLKTC